MSAPAPQPGAGQGSVSQENDDEESGKEEVDGVLEAPPGDSEEVKEAARSRRTGEMARMIARRRRRWERRHATRYVVIPEWESPVEGVALATPDTDDEWVGEHCSQCIPGTSPEEPPSASSVI